ncbi:hypothetical protein PMIN06_013113 [Paraphaeosphaeria minitans]
MMLLGFTTPGSQACSWASPHQAARHAPELHHTRQPGQKGTVVCIVLAVCLASTDLPGGDGPSSRRGGGEGGGEGALPRDTRARLVAADATPRRRPSRSS